MKRHLIITATALICTLAAGQTPQQKSINVLVKTKGKDTPKVHRAPSSNSLVFDCTVLCDQEVALLSASRDCEANVEVCNLTTGHTEDYDTVLSASPLMIPLFGEGQYSITITLTSGQIYEGEFEL